MKEFKVGDKVRIIDSDYNMPNEAGAIGKVTEVGSNYAMVNVGEALPKHYDSDDQKSWHFTYNKDVLELVSPDSTETAQVESLIHRDQYTVREGDLRIEYTTNTRRDIFQIHNRAHHVGNVKYEDIDNLIEALTQLKEVVGKEEK